MLGSSLLGWVKTCGGRRMLARTGKASCKFFHGGGEDPALGLALLHGLHLSWARDLGDAFATVGSCLVLTGDHKLPSERRWAENHGVHLRGATLISLLPLQALEQPSGSNLTAAPWPARRAERCLKREEQQRMAPRAPSLSSSGTPQTAKPWVPLDAR